MPSNTLSFILVALLIVGWFGTTAYGHYAKMKAEIFRIEKNSEDFQRSIAALGEANAAAAKVSGEALARAIERLSEQGN